MHFSGFRTVLEAHCSAVHIHKSQTDKPPPPEFTGFEHTSVARSIRTMLPKTTWRREGSSVTEGFLFNTTSLPFSYNAEVSMPVIPPEVFSLRLSLVRNKFYQLTMRPQAYYSDILQNLSA
ncbi:hypothetical protein GQ43DRAFT_160169 [Delitschia confertaspora ATCC 74209]|uniref:Uncharacterized protein n=1 Tax=Delitschia confertaspora ATCC 74209 TaxID=1513339 RepID=A0A9P4N3M3_9PLEO|nr:hypothetical protein GQ43DRAFT_160169 [Delitschia confertaspora ATCC 74209]